VGSALCLQANFVSPERSGSEQQDNACAALLPKCRTEHEIQRRMMTLFLHNYYIFQIVCFSCRVS
jgi:hypothetical protein